LVCSARLFSRSRRKADSRPRRIAGYNPLNEPTDPFHTRVIAFYDRVYTAIRAIDPHHAIFLDGNTFASDFSHFGDAHTRWENTAYSIHDYSLFGFPSAPEAYTSTDVQRHRLRRSYEKKREWMDERGLCVPDSRTTFECTNDFVST
jgi:hypothetical protein